MAWKLTLEEINEYKAAFHLFDADKNGILDESELCLLMRSQGQNFSNEELKHIVYSMNKDTIELEFHEFLVLMAENRKTEDDKTKLIKAFKYFDRDNTGFISYDEFKHALTSIAEKLNPEEIEKLEEEIINDDNGKFRYKELVNKMIFK